MRSAKVRLPRDKTLFTTWVTSTERCTGSGASSRRTAGPLRGTSGLLLGAVARTRLVALSHAGRVERATNHLVPHTGKVLDPATTHQHDGVLLEVMAHARDVRTDL